MSSSYRWFVIALAGALACGDSSEPKFQSSGPCDAGLAINSTDAVDAAQAIGICDGLVTAAWVYPDGSPATTSANYNLGHGLLTSFGDNNSPGEGDAFLALSSGTARDPSQTGYSASFDKGYQTSMPAGFPKKQTGCPDPSTSGYDGVALHVELEVPEGVRFLAFDYAYFTRDYPTWVCSEFIDQAAALVTGLTGSTGVQNVLLDPNGNAMLVSPTAIRACTPSGAYTCPLGTTLLAETGFDTNGGSGWLRTSNLPVTPGTTIEITFAVWDTGDGINDSSLLLDNFTWIP